MAWVGKTSSSRGESGVGGRALRRGALAVMVSDMLLLGVEGVEGQYWEGGERKRKRKERGERGREGGRRSLRKRGHPPASSLPLRPLTHPPLPPAHPSAHRPISADARIISTCVCSSQSPCADLSRIISNAMMMHWPMGLDRTMIRAAARWPLPPSLHLHLHPPHKDRGNICASFRAHRSHARVGGEIRLATSLASVQRCQEIR